MKEIDRILRWIETGAEGLDFADLQNWLANQKFSPEDKARVARAIEKAQEDVSGVNGGFGELAARIKLGGWIAEWLVHTKSQRAPSSVHFAVGMTAIAASCRNVMYCEVVGRQVRPALQCLAMGRSGAGKSSASTYLFDTLASEAFFSTKTASHFYPWHRLPDTTTIASMLGELKKVSDSSDVGLTGNPFHDRSTSALLVLSELVNLINESKFNMEAIPTLGELFDGGLQFRKTTLKDGEIHLYNPTISAVMFTNSGFLGKSFQEDAFSSGFMSRVLILNDDNPRKTTDMVQGDQDRGAGVRLVMKLAEFREMRERFEVYFTQDAEDYWKEHVWSYYFDRAEPPDGRYEPLYTRLPTHIARMAMLLAVSGCLVGKDLTITKEYVWQAHEIWKWAVASTKPVYDLIGRSYFGRIQAEILDYLKSRNGAAPLSGLIEVFASRVSMRALEEHLQTLEAAKKIKSSTWNGEILWELRRK